ncbi:conserved Plasmodium protein, unknown function [Plasmodium gallinaceum]|uniref:F-box domain-containing protein n=1 Tax=Plasmodium gallinaceum TaxID=5849 RepID=A0A1J1GMR0_PLAGA|nr:conserved Plasmodium protein, unknown function [Plasmodium gallinaceum]CRG93728.1 conserved Plasmodium protein, unknown function [Plasmodium gallinaceum]
MCIHNFKFVKMINKDNINKKTKSKKHRLEDECISDNQVHILNSNNIPYVKNNTCFCENNKKKVNYLTTFNTLSNNYNIFKNSDIICNILSFLTFSERWKFKLLNKSFYTAFNTKYAWANLDFRFINVDLFNYDFLKKYNKLFYNTFSLSLSVNGNESVGTTINLIIKHFKYLKDLRIYFRKKNTNFIYEGVHPIVSNILNCKSIKENKKEIRKDKKCLYNCLNGNNNNMVKNIKDEKKEYEKKDKKNVDNNTHYGMKDGETNKIKNCKLNLNENEYKKNYLSPKYKEITNQVSFLDSKNEIETKTKSQKNNDKSNFSLKMEHRTNNDNHNVLSCDFIDSNLEFNDFFLENYYYKYMENKNEIKDNRKLNELLQKYIRIIEGKKKWKTKNMKLHNNFDNLERLIIDVELKGEELLCFVGKLNNLKDIIISKLLYSNKLNRSQNIIIFTCFIEKMKQNNIRLIQLGLYFRHEYKPIDYLNNEKFRKILSERKEYIYDINKEEGDELIHILQKNHLNSLYCLWSNDLFISFEMYEQIKKFHNLKIWILPGWRALSLAKQ